MTHISTTSSGSPDIKPYHIRFTAEINTTKAKSPREATAKSLLFPELNAATKDHIQSVFDMADQFRDLTANPHTAEMRAASEDFITFIEAILRGCIHLPARMRSGPRFDLAFKGVVFSGSGFLQRVPSAESGPYFVDEVQVSLQWLHMTMASLRELLRVIQCLRDVPKPLPAIPPPDDESPLVLEYPASAIAEEDAMFEEEVALMLERPPSTPMDVPMPPASPSTESSSPATPHSVSFRIDSTCLATDVSAMEASIEPVARGIVVKSSLKRLVLGVARKRSRKALTLAMWSNASFSKSSTTMAPSPCLASFGGESPSTEAPCPPSAADSIDPAFAPDTDETAAARDVYHGASRICAASLPGLVRLLTSKAAVTDASLNHLFFFSFRFFTTAQEFVSALAERCNEGAPGGLAPGQVACWEDDARVTKVRVAKVLLVWLRQYWRHEWHAEALDALRQLVASQRAADPKAASVWGQVAAQLAVASENPAYRGCWAQKLAAIFPPSPPPSPPLKFQLVTKDAIGKGAFQSVDVLHFHTSTGREELARQLCLAASELFCAIDPEDAVHFWKAGSDSGTGSCLSRMSAFENALAYWVAGTVVDKPTVRSRAEAMEFFLDLAARVLELRNYACACAISAGLGLIMSRLRETTSTISEAHRATAHRIEAFFALHNRKAYRLALAADQSPTVPLLATFKHDIDVAFTMRSHRAHPDFPEETLIDLDRYRVVARVIQSMEACRASYRFQRVGYVHKWLRHVLDEFASQSSSDSLHSLDEMSERVEPRKTHC